MVELTAEKEDHERIMKDEYEAAAEYTSKYLRAKLEVTKLNRANQPEQTPQIYEQISAGDNADSKRRFKLPKIELKKFDGDLKDWLQFWSQFKNIHEDKSITTEDKFQYLIQAMIPNSRAADLVNKYKDELLVEVYVRKLLTLVISKAIKSSEQILLSKIYDKLEAQLRALESLGVTKDKCAAMLYPLVESSLPEELMRTWKRQATEIKSDNIEETLTKFNLNDNKPSCNNNNKLGKKKIRSINEVNIPTATGLLTRESKNVNQSTKNYLFCREERRSSRCPNTQACKFNSKCQWCGKKHSILWCREILNKDKSLRETTSEDLNKHNKEANLASASLILEVCLQTIRVILKNDNKERVQAAEEMEYQLHCENRVVHLLFGGTSTKPQNHRGYLIHLKSLDREYACNFMAFNQDIICHGIPSINNGPLVKRNIILTDVGQSTDPIEVLIGADVIGKLMTGKLHNLECGMTAVKTKLSWTLMGKKPTEENSKHDAALIVTSMLVQEADISSLWSLDVMGITDPVKTKSRERAQEEICERFRQAVTINENKRYEICLSWKENHPNIETNKEIAQKRLLITTEKLKRQGLYEEYNQVFMKWLKEGIIEKVTVEEETLWGHYLPHRHVLKENSTTRLRPVFDASAKSKNGVSLNQCLETGPNLIELNSINTFTITPRDRNVLRFLWWNKNNIIGTYRHTRVVFGVTSSPFILAAVIKLHLERIAQEDQFIHMSDTIKKLFSSFYVYICVTIVDSVEELYQFKEESKILMTEGGFNLRGHKTFDPIGFACPVLLYPKLLLQTLEWDTEVPQEVEQEFRKWYYQLYLLKEVKIPRSISNSYRADNKISFHVFVDASQVAYASVIYMRTQSLTDTKIQLIAAKSRVTPNKKMTIPRLELLAATIGARLMKSILETMENNQQEVYLWSDSTIVLTWIQRESQWATFVWNCVQEIRKITNVECWRYVPGVLNPADLSSRGELSAREFCEAEKTVLRFVQEESFSGDQDLRIKDFRAYTDRDNLIRIKTLITQRDDDINFCEPVVLNPKHPVVMSLISHYHEKLQHVGVQTVLNEIRNKFWILQGRKSVWMIVNKCITCKRYKASHVNAEPVALAKNRVGNAVPFEISGVDFAGPVYLKENQKGWICLFTCAIYRTVYLELVTSLPTITYSDNGTDFTVQKIEWWGGWWERLVRVMKELLRKVLKKSSLTYEEMCITLCDCEAIINSRPITYQSDSINEPRPLSPAMFLLEAKSIEVPDLDYDLRRLFRSEYLGQLSRKQPCLSRKSTLRVGEIVLVGNDNQKHLDWPLARIVETIAGKDGKIRVVRLKTANGELVRPVQRIYQLEINSPIEQKITKENKQENFDPLDITEVTLSKENENEECQLVKKPSLVTKYERQVKISKRLGLND
ncbi:hypothetical protein ILUMI_19680 [Ignelater luminosus]|uniref:Uncharacterized protein n=1 Tax=Ignelater luminosus TaxID=2038154 RepID=A0A8K0CFQ7_IGNLU|nr:hypothetical protein ILUMI_19680 [Ignelater luminosus]